MDCITIKRLEVFARHGAIPAENTLGQKFLITARMYFNIRQAGLTDDLKKSVNYAEAAALIKKVTEENTFQLIERLAEVLAEKILLTFSTIRRVDIDIEKPWAPVLLPLETVAVSISRSWHTVFLGLGSNMGDKKAHLDQAVAHFQGDQRSRVKKVASYLITKPVGYLEQEDFLNSVMCIDTLNTPDELLQIIRAIEKEQERKREIHWGPRTIDVDILLYDDEVIQTEELTVPHVEMANRLFVLEPMCEIAPFTRHPLTGQTMLEMKETCMKKIEK